MATEFDDGIDLEQQAPEGVFELLADETRIGILRALGETPDSALAFSALYDRVDVADSGNFNYHLDRLTGVFVDRTDDGYELTHAGRQVVGAMYAGTYTTNATVEAMAVGWDCLLCGGEMLVSYADERATFRCDDCGKGAAFAFPPGSLDQFSRSELPTAFARWYHQLFQRVVDGFCHVCAGRLDGELRRPPGGTEADPQPSLAAFECRRCGSVATISGVALASFHPIVQGFLAEHGFDVSARHPSQVWGELDRFETLIRSRDPIRLEVQFEHAGEVVSVELAPDATMRGERRAVED